MTGREYEFCIEGALSQELLEGFQPVRSDVDQDRTVFSCRVEDDAQLFGFIARCELLGLRLVSLRQPSWRAS